jgi:hypothetical protein
VNPESVHITTEAAPAPSPGGTQTDHGWLWRIWAVVGVFAVVTGVWSRHVGIPLRDPHGDILLKRIGLSLGLAVVLALVDAVRRSRQSRPLRRGVRGVLRERWTRRRTVLTLGGLLAYHLVYFCYHNLKSWDVLNHPRDGSLLRWDRWLFLGHSPAVLLHHALGEHLAAYALMVVYESFSTLVSVTVVAAIVFTDRIRDGYVFIASAIYVWILGVASYYLIPSLGPFQSAPQEFAGLPHTMIQDTQARYLGQRAYLLAHPQAHDAFAQVSAFASLHVAITCLILLMARYYRLRMATWAMTAFLFGTVLATVYLGWHFFVDDLAGVAIAFSGVALGRLTVYPRGRRTPTEAGAESGARAGGEAHETSRSATT